jgi:hypothetical protein
MAIGDVTGRGGLETIHTFKGRFFMIFSEVELQKDLGTLRPNKVKISGVTKNFLCGQDYKFSSKINKTIPVLFLQNK